MITLTSFQLKWLEKLVLYHINEDNNVQAKLSASQYVFVLELLRKLFCMNLCAVWSIALFEKSHRWVFSWILVCAFDNVTFRSFVAGSARAGHV